MPSVGGVLLLVSYEAEGVALDLDTAYSRVFSVASREVQYTISMKHE